MKSEKEESDIKGGGVMENERAARQTNLFVHRPVYEINELNTITSYTYHPTTLKEVLFSKFRSWSFVSYIFHTIPILYWLPRYQWRKNLMTDILSGTTVAVMHIPQGMAYGLIGNLPPIVGIYMAFFPVLIYCIFGTSRHVSIGTFAVVCLMTGKVVAEHSHMENSNRHNGTSILEPQYTKKKSDENVYETLVTNENKSSQFDTQAVAHSDHQVTPDNTDKEKVINENIDAHNVVYNLVASEEKLSNDHVIQHAPDLDTEILEETTNVAETNPEHIDGTTNVVHNVNYEYYINEVFINEEKKSVLNTSPIISTKEHENVVKSDAYEQEAITVLNDVIQEAAGTNSVSHALEEEPEKLSIKEDNVAVVPEHSRKRVIIGDPPTKEEISAVHEGRTTETQEKVCELEKPHEEFHEISIVRESHYDNKKQEKVVSHIYLESVNTDDVHYTLDKLQLMEEQIQSTRSRILSIKEID